MRNLIIPGVTGQKHCFTPSWLENLKPKPVFIFRSCTLGERAQYVADLDTECGPEPWQDQFDEAFRAGLAALLPVRPDQPENAAYVAQVLEILDANRSRQPVSDDEMSSLNKAWEMIKKSWPDMRDLQRRVHVRANYFPALAFKYFCTGLENVTDANGAPILFETDNGGRLTDAAILRIDPSELKLAGLFGHNLQYGPSAEKNSALPSKSEETPEPLTEALKAPGSSNQTTSGTNDSTSPKTPEASSPPAS